MKTKKTKTTSIIAGLFIVLTIFLPFSFIKAEPSNTANEVEQVEQLKNAIINGETKSVLTMIQQNPSLVHAKISYPLDGDWKYYFPESSKVTPLYVAAGEGKLEIVKALFKRGADIDKGAYAYGYTPLHIAATRGYLDVVVFLFEKGANMEAKGLFFGLTPLHWACSNGKLDVVIFFIEKGINVDIASSRNLTPLYEAAYHGHLDVVDFLLNRGANIEGLSSNTTPLIEAARNSRLDVVIFFVNRGANIEAKTGYLRWKPMTALQWAKRNGHKEVADFLRKQSNPIP